MHKPKDLGGIPPERMAGVPEHLRLIHEATFYFSDRVGHAMSEISSFGPRSFAVSLPPDFSLTEEQARAMDGITLARAAGADAQAKTALLGDCVLALIADALSYISEALFSYEKGKISVSLSLMRKPLKENLLLLEWILADEDGFFQAFGSEDRKVLSLAKLTPERRKEIIQAALQRIEGATFEDAGALFDLRYNKAFNGLEPLWQKAQHLTTTQHSNLRTETENLNFIFANPDNIAGIYARVAPIYLLLVLHFYDVALAALQRTYERDPAIHSVDQMAKAAALAMAHGNAHLLEDVFGGAVELCRGGVRCECGAVPDISTATFSRALFAKELPCSACGGVTPFNLYELMANSDNEGADPA